MMKVLLTQYFRGYGARASICVEVSEGQGPGFKRNFYNCTISLPIHLPSLFPSAISPSLSSLHPSHLPLSFFHTFPPHSSPLHSSLPPSLPLPMVQPLIKLAGLGSDVCFDERSERRTSTKRLVVHFELKKCFWWLQFWKVFCRTNCQSAT